VLEEGLGEIVGELSPHEAGGGLVPDLEGHVAHGGLSETGRTSYILGLAVTPLWRNVWVMSGTILCTLTGIFTWNRVMPVYLDKLGAGGTDIGVAYLVLAFCHRLPQLLGGYLADRIGRKGIVVTVTFLMGCCYVAIGFARTWPAVVALVALCWVIGAVQWPALLSIVADSVPEHQRGRAIAMLETASMIGYTVGPFAGAWILERTDLLAGGWTRLLMVCAALYLFAAVARGFALVETVRTGTREPFWTRLAAIDWRILGVPAAAFVVASVLYMLAIDGPFQSRFLDRECRFDPARIDLLNFYGGLVALPSALAAGWLTDRLGAERVLQASFVLAGAALVPFAAGSGTSLGPAVFVALNLPASLFMVSYEKLITTAAPERERALYVSVAGLLSGLVAPWSNPGGMFLYERNASWPFFAALACAALGLGASLFLRRNVKSPESSPAPAIE
jgi:DHA1 family multidrug resistance protein-like MFS transporter